MTSPRRGKAPLTPGARGAKRDAWTCCWSSRHPQPAVLLGVLILSVLPLANAPPPGTGLLQAVLDGEKLEDTTGGVRRCVDVVPPGVLEEHDCSAAAPCWALVKAKEPLAPLDGGVQVSSVSSMALLRTHSHGTGCTNLAPRSLRGVLNHDILTALFALDPMSYVTRHTYAMNTPCILQRHTYCGRPAHPLYGARRPPACMDARRSCLR